MLSSSSRRRAARSSRRRRRRRRCARSFSSRSRSSARALRPVHAVVAQAEEEHEAKVGLGSRWRYDRLSPEEQAEWRIRRTDALKHITEMRTRAAPACSKASGPPPTPCLRSLSGASRKTQTSHSTQAQAPPLGPQVVRWQRADAVRRGPRRVPRRGAAPRRPRRQGLQCGEGGSLLLQVERADFAGEMERLKCRLRVARLCQM
jgi:hypothetical protein